MRSDQTLSGTNVRSFSKEVINYEKPFVSSFFKGLDKRKEQKRKLPNIIWSPALFGANTLGKMEPGLFDGPCNYGMPS